MLALGATHSSPNPDRLNLKRRQHTLNIKMYARAHISIVCGYYRMFIQFCGFFFKDFKIYSGLWPLSVSPWCQCVGVHNGRSNASAAENFQSSEKSQYIKKNTIFNEHPLLDYFSAIILINS